MSQNPLSVSQHPQSEKDQLISKILSDFQNQYRLDLSQDPVALERITEAVDQAFRNLETSPSAEIDLPFISANSAGPIHLKLDIDRAGLAGDAAPVVDGDGVEEPETSARQVDVQLPARKPLITIALLAMMAVIYGLQQFTYLIYGVDLLAAYGMKSNELIIGGEYWRLVTAIFLHGSIIHVGFNLYALHILGRRVERFFGPFRFLSLFMIAGITGNLFSFIFTSAPSLGSSTAIFGLLGAEGIFIYQHRKLFGEQFRTALRQIIQVAAGNLVIGFLVPGIDNWGHIGGLIGGAVFTWFAGPLFKIIPSSSGFILENQRTRDRALIIFLTLLGMVVLLVAWIILARN